MGKGSNPTLETITDESTLSEELRADPQGFLCESLCVWVDDPTANQPLVEPEARDSCITSDVDASELKRLWLGIDLDQDMAVGHLVVAGWDGERLVVPALETWSDPLESAVAERDEECCGGEYHSLQINSNEPSTDRIWLMSAKCISHA